MAIKTNKSNINEIINSLLSDREREAISRHMELIEIAGCGQVHGAAIHPRSGDRTTIYGCKCANGKFIVHFYCKEIVIKTANKEEKKHEPFVVVLKKLRRDLQNRTIEELLAL